MHLHITIVIFLFNGINNHLNLLLKVEGLDSDTVEIVEGKRCQDFVLKENGNLIKQGPNRITGSNVLSERDEDKRAVGIYSRRSGSGPLQEPVQTLQQSYNTTISKTRLNICSTPTLR